jgi:hypothetical protein
VRLCAINVFLPVWRPSLDNTSSSKQASLDTSGSVLCSTKKESLCHWKNTPSWYRDMRSSARRHWSHWGLEHVTPRSVQDILLWVTPVVPHSHIASRSTPKAMPYIHQRHTDEEMSSRRRRVATAPNGSSRPLHSRHDEPVTW